MTHRMTTLKIVNPADGSPIAEVPADDAASIAAKAARARAAQPAWNATPLADRIAVMTRFRASAASELETLATTLTMEVGKPLAQSRNELNGFLGRIDFFLAEVTKATAPETVFGDASVTERIDHDPLGVVANVSAWNYPYFVGGNVFVPALLTGNAVLYKPSEFATLTGLHIDRLLHAAGVPADVFITLVGNGEVGAALLEQTVDGVFFTGSAATGAKIATQMGPRMVRLQLELGGKDPTYVADDADVRGAGAQRVVADHRLQGVAVPGLAHDRRQRVSFAGEDLEDLSELLLEHEPAFVGGRVAIGLVDGISDLGDEAFAGAEAAGEAPLHEVGVGLGEDAADVAP